MVKCEIPIVIQEQSELEEIIDAAIDCNAKKLELCFYRTYFNKTATSDWLVAFHQDRSIPVMPSAAAQQQSGWSQKEGMTFVHGPDILLKQLIAVRLHLDDSTLENGPLRVIPRSHQYGTLTPESAKEIRDSCQEEALLVEKGGAIAMRPLILHASSKSQVEKPRRVLHFLFAPSTLPNGLEWRLFV